MLITEAWTFLCVRVLLSSFCHLQRTINLVTTIVLLLVNAVDFKDVDTGFFALQLGEQTELQHSLMQISQLQQS